MLLASAWKRLLVAGAAVAALWLAVLYVAPNTPLVAPEQPAMRPVAVATSGTGAEAGPLGVLVRSGQEAPSGGSFDRFLVPSQDAAAPVNAAGQAAFYATVLHAPGREGIFLAGQGRVAKIAAFGDAAPGGGTLSGFSNHPLPALNAAGHVAFVAQIGGGRSTEGIFLSDDGLRAVALAGGEAPGVPLGMLIGFDQPALNDNDEIAFVASVRTGADNLADRVCMTAAMLVLEPIFEADLPSELYAYRPGRNAQQAVVEVEELLFRGHPEVVDADLADYLDTRCRTDALHAYTRIAPAQRRSGRAADFLAIARAYA